MSNDTVRIAIGLRVGAAICHPHPCAFCGKDVGQFGFHGLSCSSSQGRTLRHNFLNNIIYRSLAAAKVSSRLEPSGLHRADGNRPDGVTMIPWSEGRFLVWDATRVDTFCQSHRQRCAGEAGAAAAHAEGEKGKKYSHLDQGYFFQPVAFETSGAVGPDSMSFLKELGYIIITIIIIKFILTGPCSSRKMLTVTFYCYRLFFILAHSDVIIDVLTRESLLQDVKTVCKSII